METRSHLKERPNPTKDLCFTLSWWRNPGENFEQRAFASAIPPNYTNNLSGVDIQRHIFEGPNGFF
jgi:hypothetical protein